MHRPLAVASLRLAPRRAGLRVCRRALERTHSPTSLCTTAAVGTHWLTFSSPGSVFSWVTFTSVSVVLVLVGSTFAVEYVAVLGMPDMVDVDVLEVLVIVLDVRLGVAALDAAIRSTNSAIYPW